MMKSLPTTIKWTKAFLEALWGVVFPPFCFSCQSVLAQRKLLCPKCLVQLSYISPVERCERCFQQSLYPLCDGCSQIKKGRPYRQAALFERESVGDLCIETLKRWICASHAKTIASLLIVAHHRLGWPLPERIVISTEQRSRLFPDMVHKELQEALSHFCCGKGNVLWITPTLQRPQEKPKMVYGRSIYRLAFTE